MGVGGDILCDLPQQPFTIMNIKDRLLRKIRINKATGCWEWTAAKNSKGYGFFSINGRTRLAHRVSYQYHKGHLPLDSLVCHTCDNPSCVNPDHLFLGTNDDNIADSITKGRSTTRFLPKKIIDKNGMIYNGQKDCASKTGLNLKTVEKILSKKRKTNELGLRYLI